MQECYSGDSSRLLERSRACHVLSSFLPFLQSYHDNE